MNYTFEDWLNGIIGADGKEEQVSKLMLDYYIKKEGLPPEEVNKINEHRKQAFDWAVEINFDSLKWCAEKSINRVRHPENWLRLEIQKIEKFINDNPELEQEYEEGNRDTGYISGEKFKRIKNYYATYQNEGKSGSTIIRVEERPKRKYVPSQLQRMYEHKAYLSYLKEQLRKTESSDGRKNNKQGDFIQPEDAFWKEVSRWSVSAIRNSRGNPKKDTIDSLLKKKYNGYKVSDTSRKNPIPLTRGTIRERLIHYIEESAVK